MPMTNRGQHPDLNEDGTLKADAYLPPAQRDFRRIGQDQSANAAFTQRVAREQAQYPTEVQRYVQGRQFGSYDEYVNDRAWAMQEYGRRRGADRVITDGDVSRMSLQEYDQHFDERGQPREGVLLWRTSRSHRIDDGMDSASQGELRNLRSGR